MNVDFSGDLLTQGLQAHGLFMQSIGGGGGLALYNGIADTIDVALGSSGGATGTTDAWHGSTKHRWRRRSRGL